MKLREKEQLKNKPKAELEKNLSEYRDKLWSLKTALVGGKVKNVSEIKEVKKNIARILTILNLKI
jgi:large subunit ribosomal protein L29